MSQSASSCAGSTSPPQSRFDNPRDWDATLGRGSALRAPEWLKTRALVGTIRVESLEVSQHHPFSKNHIVAVVAFSEPCVEESGGLCYYEARISMEKGDEWDVIEAEGLRAGVHYSPGELTITLQTHTGQSQKSQQAHTFPLRHGTVIENLVQAATDKKMHHFAFLPYGMGKWKGCADFILHWWAVLYQSGIVTSTDSQENPDSSLGLDLTVTYISSGEEFIAPIGRGWFFYYNPADDDLTPAHVYYDQPPVPNYDSV